MPRLYFQNLHYVHPIIDQADFISRCRSEIWESTLPPKTLTTRSYTVFLALFNAVLALGAITAGEDSLFARLSAPERSSEGVRFPNRDSPVYQPLRIAKTFFERAKTCLGDVFESSSFESTQTLFLMSVFCQNALKSHSCYLYSGMAARTALAIGIPNCAKPESVQANILWW